MMKWIKYIAFTLTALFIGGCDNYWGDKTDLGFIDIPNYEVREVAYVPLEPKLYDVAAPVDIAIGFDEFLYVVDSVTSEIARFDLAFQPQGRIFIPGVTKVFQDRRLQLLAIGTSDTTVNGVDYDLTTIYRINFEENGILDFNNATIEKVAVHPFYFKNSFSSSDASVKFTDIAVQGGSTAALNNRYYISRTGTNTNNAGFGPDNAVVVFSNTDDFVSSVPVTAAGAVYNNYFKRPLAMASFTQAPQISAQPSQDFWVINNHPDQSIQVQHVQFEEGPFGAVYQPVFYSTTDPVADSYLQTANRFINPIDIAFAGDANAFVFIADGAVDSVYQFTSNGLEGVPPPPASTADKHAIATIGGFEELSALCYYDKILYVADKQAGTISRYQLTLDFE
jgi:hypothetical protein